MDSTNLIKAQNRIIVKLLWVVTILAFANNALTVRDPIAGGLIVIFIGGFALGMSYLVYTNKMIQQSKYLAVAGMFLASFIFIQFTPGILSYFTIYICLFILSIYHDRQVILVSGILAFLLSSYSFIFHRNMIFHPRYDSFLSMISINFFIILACCLLVLQIKFGSRLYRD